MKKLFGLVALIGLLALPAAAQINTNTPTTVLDFLNHTNLYVGAGPSYDLTTHKVGGVVGLAYQLDVPVVQDMILPMVRFDLNGEEVCFIEGTLTIKPPRSIAGKWPIRPVGEVGIATSFSGLELDNGKAVPLVGAGIQANIVKNLGLIAGYEWWFYPQPEKTHEKVVVVLTWHF